MATFEIKEEFMLNQQPMKIISGAVHYFRIAPSQWEDSLYNLKALGANTVETYIPWNLHEPQEGQYDFAGIKDIEKFVILAQKMGLYVILRPSAYICAEWEFGGLPAWLLTYQGVRLRSTDPIFMEKIRQYFSVLLPKLVPLQINFGGPVLMMQIENEYGSYGMEKDYLKETKLLMEEFGIIVPLFTSDGSWEEVLDAGSLIEEDVFITGNFGSHSKENSLILKKMMDKYHKNWPIMCMEYWDGWFNRWGEEIVKRDPEDLAMEVKAMLEIGSINLYMFHGGTNFGFYNGCSARGAIDLPQVTSYDYDALLTEWGEPTEKYYAVQKVIKEVCPQVIQMKPKRKHLKNFGKFSIENSVSLLYVKDQLKEVIQTKYPLTMEAIGSNYGYLLYSLECKNYHHENKMKIVEANDRIQVYIDQKYQLTQYQESLGEEFFVEGQATKDHMDVDILVENVGRVNYGFKMNNPTQSKGIRGGVMQDIHFHQGYTQYPLTFEPEQLAQIDYSAGKNPKQPSFYQTFFDIEEVGDTFIDCSSYGKGVIIVNGNHLGRYWNQGPIQYVYCPKDFVRVGRNEIIIFETEGIEIKDLIFSDVPLCKKIN